MGSREDRPNLTADQKARIVEFEGQFKSHAFIAAQLGVDRSTVTKYLARIEYTADEDATMQAMRTKVRATQLRKLEHIALEAMDAWERSKAPQRHISKKRRSRTRMPDMTSDVTETLQERSASEQAGNPAFLTVARQALADIRALVGADAPTQLHTSVTGAFYHGTSQEFNTKILANPQANQLVHDLLETLDQDMAE